jgi:hypothetical protein
MRLIRNHEGAVKWEIQVLNYTIIRLSKGLRWPRRSSTSIMPILFHLRGEYFLPDVEDPIQ